MPLANLFIVWSVRNSTSISIWTYHGINLYKYHYVMAPWAPAAVEPSRLTAFWRRWGSGGTCLLDDWSNRSWWHTRLFTWTVKSKTIGGNHLVKRLSNLCNLCIFFSWNHVYKRAMLSPMWSLCLVKAMLYESSPATMRGQQPQQPHPKPSKRINKVNFRIDLVPLCDFNGAVQRPINCWCTHFPVNDSCGICSCAIGIK